MEVSFWTLELYSHVSLDTNCLDLHIQLVTTLEQLKAGLINLHIAQKVMTLKYEKVMTLYMHLSI